MGTIAEINKALNNIKCSGGDAGSHINISKCRAYWPSMTSTTLRPLLEAFLLYTRGDGGLVLPGAPLGNDTFVKAYLQTKIESCAEALRPLADIPEARMRFHLHRVTASVYRVEHVF